MAENISTQNYLDSALIYLVHQNYDEASCFLSEYTQNYPSDNEALYLSFVIEQTRILDYESYFDECQSFIALADSLKSVFEKRMLNLHGKDSVECLLYIANITGGIGIILSKTGNWYDAVKNAINSVAILKKVKKLDPQCYEANLGIGVFNYYLNNRFKWIPFVNDKGKEGIKLVEQALKSRFPYNYAAKSSLCWILIEQGDLRKADSLAGSVLNELPDNTIFLRIKSHISLWNGKYDKARESAQRIIRFAEKREPFDWSNMTTAYNILVSSYEEQKNTEKACFAAEEFMSRKIPQKYYDLPHTKKSIKQIVDIQKKNCQ